MRSAAFQTRFRRRHDTSHQHHIHGRIHAHCYPSPLTRPPRQVHALLPYSAGDLLNDLHTGGRVKNQEYKEVRRVRCGMLCLRPVFC